MYLLACLLLEQLEHQITNDYHSNCSWLLKRLNKQKSFLKPANILCVSSPFTIAYSETFTDTSPNLTCSQFTRGKFCPGNQGEAFSLSEVCYKERRVKFNLNLNFVQFQG